MDSTTAQRVRDHDWESTNYQIANLHDELRDFMAMCLAHWGNGQIKQPPPVPRPGVVLPEDEHQAKSTNNAIAYIEKYRAQRGA